ncbi:MAG TPA: fatty acid desaturase [Calditrichaeota bacterium]|nr:fatty acid desaturase [Calditrichota bacterium]
MINAKTATVTHPSWLQELSQYAQSHAGKALWQLINTVIPYLFLWAGMIYLTLNGYSYWFTLALSIPTAGFMVRTFILFHDCCHGSFFPSRRANTIVGYITGILTFTPFEEWRRLHNIHHATSGDLDRRGTGDIWTMTVQEYRLAGRGKRLAYRLVRNPIVFLGFGPVFLFLYSNRFVHKGAKAEERRSVMVTNLALLSIVSGLSWWIGFQAYLLIQIPVFFFGGMIGIWLFYVQHQYEGTYWANSDEWNLVQSALNGSSFYKLPKIFQWFTGNIGFHHIHHLRPRIPNYNLEKCNRNIPALRNIKPLTLKNSLRTMRLHLWDEEKQKMVGFGSIK